MNKGPERLALFIDGANLHAAARTLGFDIDFRKLLREYQGAGYLVRAFYYTALVEDQEYSSLRPLIDWLDYNGYSVVTKAAREFTDSTGRRRVKGNMDIELAVDAMELADRLDHMVLFSGDGDFRSLVAAMQRRGVRVSVVSTLVTQPAMVSDELRRQADEFVDLAALQPRIGRDPAERAARSAGGYGHGGVQRNYGDRGGERQGERTFERGYDRQDRAPEQRSPERTQAFGGQAAPAFLTGGTEEDEDGED